jgi:hypothetical protein
MKLIVLFILSMFVTKNCSDTTNNDFENAVVEYTTSSRGFYQKIILTNKIISISKNRNGAEKPLSRSVSEDDQNDIVAGLKTIQLDKLSSLESPTKKRLNDGAAIANLKITYKGKSYQTASFDHGYPPESIKKLVEKMNSFAKKE